MILYGALAGIVAMHVYDAICDWWRSRSDSAVDSQYRALCDALRASCGQVEVPAFRLVVPLYDWAEDGAA